MIPWWLLWVFAVLSIGPTLAWLVIEIWRLHRAPREVLAHAICRRCQVPAMSCSVNDSLAGRAAQLRCVCCRTSTGWHPTHEAARTAWDALQDNQEDANG